MFGKHDPEVLIIGAGPVGLFAGVLLRKRGIAVEVLDAAHDTAGRSYAIAMHPSTLALLDEHGLLKPLLEHGNRLEQLAFYDDERERATVSLADLPGPHKYALAVPQNVVENLLEARLKQAGGRMSWNHRAMTLRERDDRVAIEVDVLEKDSVGYAVAGTEWVVAKQRKLEVPFVIGADGHQSVVRRRLAIAHETVGPRQAYRVFEFEGDPAEIDHTVRVILGEHGAGVLWPLPNGRWRWSFETSERPDLEPEDRFKSRLTVDPRDRGGAEQRDALTALIAERAPWFEARVGAVLWSTVVPFQPRLATHFGAGRQWLAGDAAHLPGPVGIHSMNVGLREAADLVARVHDVLRGGKQIDHMAGYDAERLAEWRHLLGVEGAVDATDAADAWVAEHRAEIASCLPSTGADLERLAGSLGLSWAPGSAPA